MNILVTGAAGYIGSVVTEVLIDQGNSVVALDNLQAGHREAVHPNAVFVQADLDETPRPWIRLFATTTWMRWSIWLLRHSYPCP